MKLSTIGIPGRGAKPHFVKLWSGRGSEHDFAEAYALPLICSSLFTPHRWICGLTSNVTRFSEHFGRICPIFNCFRGLIFCPVLYVTPWLTWSGTQIGTLRPNRSQSADLVPAQVLHAKVQSCRADTRKTSFWIGAIREAKESSAAEKQ
jgi:hypothetical protein